MKCVDEFRHKPPEVQKVLMLLMLCLSQGNANYEIDYKRYCQPAMDRWTEAFSGFPRVDENEAAEKVICRILDELPGVMRNALKTDSPARPASGQY